MLFVAVIVCISCAEVTSAMSFVYPLGFLDNIGAGGKLIVTACSSDISSNVSISLWNTTYTTIIRPSTCYDLKFNQSDMYSNVSEPYFAVPSSLPSQVYSTSYGIQVMSDWPIHVYGVNNDDYSTSRSLDGFLVFPITNISTEFIVAGYRYSGTLITSVYPDTVAEIYKVTGNTYMRLNRIEIASSNSNYFRYYRDLPNWDPTGLFINSTKPIGLLSGCKCVNIPLGAYYCDHVVEQIPPISELGASYIVPPIFGRAEPVGYLVRVVAADTDTIVQWSSSSQTTPPSATGLTRGQYVEISVNRAWSALAVTCTKPCVVMQFNKGANASGAYEDTDPFSMLTTPNSHFYTTAAFNALDMATPPRPQHHFISVVTLRQHLGDVLLDGQPIMSFANVMLSQFSEYSVVTTTTVPGTHTLNVTKGSTATFAGYHYLHSWNAGYGYSLTYRLAAHKMAQATQATTTDILRTTEATASPSPVIGVHCPSPVASNTAAVIAGSVVGGVVLLVFICAVTICIVRRKAVGSESKEQRADSIDGVYLTVSSEPSCCIWRTTICRCVR